MGEFKVKFRGIRGSHPVAKPGYLKYGGNTSCVEVNVNGHLIILDAGTGIISLGEELVTDHLMTGSTTFERMPIEATLILSHIHQDHIQGFQFFKPAHIPTTRLNILGPALKDNSLEEILSKVLFSKIFPLNLYDVAADVNIHNFNPEDVLILKKGSNEPVLKRIDEPEDLPISDDVFVTCYKSFAHPLDGVLVIKITHQNKSLVFATDKEGYLGGDKKFNRFAYGCDLLIHDAQYTEEDYLSPFSPKQGYGHSTIDMALEAAIQSKTKKLVLYHVDPTYDDEKIEELEAKCKTIFENSQFAKELDEIIL